MVEERYITDTCVSYYKDDDGKLWPLVVTIDESLDCYDLLCEDKSASVLKEDDIDLADDIVSDNPVYLYKDSNL